MKTPAPEPRRSATDANLGPAVEQQAETGQEAEEAPQEAEGASQPRTACATGGHGMAERRHQSGRRTRGWRSSSLALRLVSSPTEPLAAEEITEFDSQGLRHPGGRPSRSRLHGQLDQPTGLEPCPATARTRGSSTCTSRPASSATRTTCRPAALTEFSLHACSPESQVGVVEISGRSGGRRCSTWCPTPMRPA